MIKFALKVVILAAVFYVLTRFEVLPGLDVIPDPTGPLGEAGTYLWIGLIFGLVNAIVGPILRLLVAALRRPHARACSCWSSTRLLLALTAGLTDRLAIDGIVHGDHRRADPRRRRLGRRPDPGPLSRPPGTGR